MPWRQRGVEVQIHTFLTLHYAHLIGWLNASAVLTPRRRLGVPQSRRSICCPYRDWNLGPSSRRSDPSHALKPGTFIVNAELQIALIVVAVFGGAGGCVRGGADKSLARPTSRCRRTVSIVSLERGVCSCAELQVFSFYRGWKEACQATRAISTTSRRELSSFFFPAR